MDLVYYDCWKEIITYLNYRSLVSLRLVNIFFSKIVSKDDLNSKVGILCAKKENDSCIESFPIDLSLIDFTRNFKEVVIFKPFNSYIIYDDGTLEENDEYRFYGANKPISEYIPTKIFSDNENYDLKFELQYKNKKVELYLPIRNLTNYDIFIHRNEFGIVDSFFIDSPEYEDNFDTYDEDPEDDYDY